MTYEISRREWIRLLGASGLAAGLGTFASADEEKGAAPAQGAAALTSEANRSPATLAGGKVIQPQRELPVLRKTDVLVVGGGPAGVAAAIAAKRAGADVTLVERYGHFGGLWTGGLVLLVIEIGRAYV